MSSCILPLPGVHALCPIQVLLASVGSVFGKQNHAASCMHCSLTLRTANHSAAHTNSGLLCAGVAAMLCSVDRPLHNDVQHCSAAHKGALSSTEYCNLLCCGVRMAHCLNNVILKCRDGSLQRPQHHGTVQCHPCTGHHLSAQARGVCKAEGPHLTHAV